MAVPHLAEQVGRVLDGRYRVVAPIGTGASAAVYLADDVTLRRRVAIKVLHAALAGDQSFLKRFQAEAHTAAALSHPHIMRVLDWGEASDGPFLVLEYLGGGSLRSVLDHSGALTASQAVNVGLQAARALDYAHRRGLVHRDIKPANLLFDEEGRLAIADFGLARALAEAAWTEPGGAVLGTARYASPEQVRGQSLDGKSDVYALGLVLIEAVCGYVPFTADTTIATLMARLDVQLEAPPEMGALGPIVEAATNPDPAGRIDAGAMVKMLEAAAAELPAPERLMLPGAVAIDLVRSDNPDPTMLPGGLSSEPVVPDESTPPTVTEEPRQSFVYRRRQARAERKSAAARAKLAKAAPQSSGAQAMSSPPNRAKRGRVGLLFITLGLLAMLGAAAYAAVAVTGTERPVPELEGLTAEQAREAAELGGVQVNLDNLEYSETVPEGLTFGSDPIAGTMVTQRDTVKLRVSRGPAPREVQNYVGQELDEARPAITELGLNIDSTNRFDESAPVGTILQQTPAGGTLPRGGEINFVISGGPAPRTVPDVSGRSFEAASAALSDLQLKVTRSEAFNDTVPAGEVAGTSPGAGASVARGATVNVVVSKGPDLVTVPSVAGQSLNGANTAITNAGLTAEVYGPAGGSVVATKPAAGTRAKKGSAVLVYLG